MQAVILVGGEGTRLRPLTVNVPKPMMPVVNRPFLEHVVDYLRGHRITDVILSMGYRPAVIEQYFGDGRDFGIRLTYVVEQSPLGTAGGVKNVEPYLDGDTLFVFNGDILTDLDLGAMLAFHRERQAQVTISLTPVEDPTAYGLVETDASRRITQFIEKPGRDQITTNLINAGTYILQREVLSHVPAGTYSMFERGLFPLLLERGAPVYGYAADGYWLDIGTPAKYLAAHRDVLAGRIAWPIPGEPVIDGVWAGRDAVIDPTARLVGPVALGDRVRVEAGAQLIGPATVGDDCVIGAESTIEDAIIWAGSQIGPRATLRRCVVGAGCTIHADVAIANGAVVGDHCSIGSGNRLDQNIRVWPSRTLEPQTITF
ncbi:MAG: NDP-sugar synthase [Chloroflexi bacterium]|nr:NDP-sugar synthase [Chloroflexota bacterium]